MATNEELDNAIDSILNSNQDDIWKDIKNNKENAHNKFFFINSNQEYCFRLIGPALHAERIYLPLAVYRSFIGNAATQAIVSSKEIKCIKMLLKALLRGLPFEQQNKIDTLNDLPSLTSFLYKSMVNKSCHTHKNELNALYYFLTNSHEGWQKCTLINAIHINGSSVIKILPLLQSIKKTIGNLVRKQKTRCKISGLCARDIIIKKTDNDNNRRVDPTGPTIITHNPAMLTNNPLYNWQLLTTSPITTAYPYPTTTAPENDFYAIPRSTQEIQNVTEAQNTIEESSRYFKSEITISISLKEYFLSDSLVEQIIKNGLWDIKKIIEASNKEGKHVFYYRFKEDYKMPKEYLQETIDEADQKIEQDCLNEIEMNLDDLPDDAIEDPNKNNSMSKLKLNFDV